MLKLAFADRETPAQVLAHQATCWLDERGEIYGRAYSRGDLHWIEWRGLGVFEFSSVLHEVRVWPEPDADRSTLAEMFARVLQPLILQVQGWQALHAGAAVGPTGVLAFCGRKGSGKSTLALAMQKAGWQQFADDALVLRVDGAHVMACPLPFVPRLRPASRAHFAHSHEPKRSSSKPVATEVPLTSAFILQQNACAESPRVSSIPQGAAFSELLAHAHCFNAEDPIHTRRLVEDYLELVARVPVFRLEYRPDFQDLPKLVRAVVEAAPQVDTFAASASKLRPAALLR